MDADFQTKIDWPGLNKLADNIHELSDLASSRLFFERQKHSVILSNKSGASRLYGSLVIDHAFKALNKEFSHKISAIVFNAGDDLVSLITAIELGYRRIIFTGEIY